MSQDVFPWLFQPGSIYIYIPKIQVAPCRQLPVAPIAPVTRGPLPVVPTTPRASFTAFRKPWQNTAIHEKNGRHHIDSSVPSYVNLR